MLKKRILRYFPALSHRNFQLFFTGQIVSLIGTWMQNAALQWLVYEITGDEFKSGLLSAVQFLPLFLFSLHAGLVIERFPKRKIIIWTQFFQLFFAGVLFVLVFTNNVKYGYLLIVMFFVGLVQSIDNPARQSFVVEMVEERDHLLNAIALNSAVFNGARLIGPAVAGWVMTYFGPKWCFFFNSLSFIAVLIGLFMMKMEDKAVREAKGVPFSKEFKTSFVEIKEGLKYIYNNPKLLYTLIVVAIVPTFCLNFNVLLPIYTVKALNLKADSYGMLTSCVGLGALISALTVAAKGKRGRQYYYQLFGAFGLGISLILLGLCRNYHLSMLILIFCGLFMIMFNTTSNSVLQLNSKDYIRGRVMSVYSLVFGGLIPIGSTYSGGLAYLAGPNITFIVSGIIGLLGFLILLKGRDKLC